MENSTVKTRSLFNIGALVGVCLVVLLPVSSYAQEKAPELDEATNKAVAAVEADFDASLKDLGELAGEVSVCEKDDVKRAAHESRVGDIYGKLTQLFGTERAFLFAASFGYGSANEQDDKNCEELTDEFEDRYGAISEKYELID